MCIVVNSKLVVKFCIPIKLWNFFTVNKTSENTPKEQNNGNGLGLTKWNGCFCIRIARVNFFKESEVNNCRTFLFFWILDW